MNFLWRRIWRILLIALLACALPLQGHAMGSMAGCGDVAEAMHADVDSGHDAGHADAEPDHERCSGCADGMSCCASSALLPAPMILATARAGVATHTEPLLPVLHFLCGGLDRPPRVGCA